MGKVAPTNDLRSLFRGRLNYGPSVQPVALLVVQQLAGTEFVTVPTQLPRNLVEEELHVRRTDLEGRSVRQKRLENYTGTYC